MCSSYMGLPNTVYVKRNQLTHTKRDQLTVMIKGPVACHAKRDQLHIMLKGPVFACHAKMTSFCISF